MTFALAATSKKAIWMCADRRISFETRAPKDDGRKLLRLDAADGFALLGYSGLGITALGTEPSDWMSNVLRGRDFTH